MENHVCQFPDLKEILYAPESYKQVVLDDKLFKEEPTEFLFFVMAVRESPSAVKFGFKPLACMNNWYHAHECEARRMTFYWMRNPLWKGEVQKPCRMIWGYNSHQCSYKPRANWQ